MKVSAAIKKTRAYFKKQGIDIEIDEPGEYGYKWTFIHNGSYRDNLTQVLHSLLPPPPKYPAGSLIRGKANKRATRCGYAGKVGLVMKADGGSYLNVAWNGEPKPARGWPCVPERDIERVS